MYLIEMRIPSKASGFVTRTVYVDTIDDVHDVMSYCTQLDINCTAVPHHVDSVERVKAKIQRTIKLEEELERMI